MNNSLHQNNTTNNQLSPAKEYTPKSDNPIEPLSFGAFQAKFHSNDTDEYMIYLLNNQWNHDYQLFNTLEEWFNHQIKLSQK